MWDQTTSVTCVHSSMQNENRSAQFVLRDCEARLEHQEILLTECRYLRAYLTESVNLGSFLILGSRGNQGHREAPL